MLCSIVSILAGLAVASTGLSHAASGSSVVVTASVPSASSLTNNCATGAAQDLGLLSPGQFATTATDASVCRFQFTSSNNSAMVQVGQADGTGSAMGAASATWTTSTAPAGVTVQAITSYDSSTVFAVGAGGTVWRSLDSGATWSNWSNVSGSNGMLYDIQPVPGDPTTWYAVGASRSVVRITNALATPSFASALGDLALSYSGGDDIRALVVQSATTIIIAGERGRIGQTTNGAVNWVAYQVGGGSNTNTDIDDESATILYVTAANGAVWKTTTGAAAQGNWSSIAVGTASLNSISVADSTHVYAVGDNSLVYACTTSPCTTLGNWTNRTDLSQFNGTLRSVASVSGAPGTAMFVGDFGQRGLSTNSGATFAPAETNTGVQLNAITIAPASDRAVAAGRATTFARSTNGAMGAWEMVTTAATTWRGAAVDPTNNRIAVIVGDSGRISRSTNGGTTWTSIAPITANALMSVAFGTTLRAWAVGANGTILYSSDGGVSWSAQTSSTNTRLLKITAIDEYTVLAAGDNGTVIRTTNAGTSWTAIGPGTTASLRGISARPDGTTVVVGGNGYVRTSTTFGTSWSIPSTPPAGTLMGVSMATSSTGFVISPQSTVYKTVNGGTDWTVAGTTTRPLMDIWALTPTIVFVASGTFGVHRSTNGGAAWTQSAVGSGSTIHALGINDGNSGVAAGADGVTGFTSPSVTPSQLVNDYGGAPNNWATAGPAGMFAMCVQAIGPQTTINSPTFTADTTPAGTAVCVAGDGDPWYPVPATVTKLAQTGTAGHTGIVDIVWGHRAGPTQTAGQYTATVVFQVIAPAI